MTIKDLCDLITINGSLAMDYAVNSTVYIINGCKLLEHIEDVEGFVSLLGEFERLNYMDLPSHESHGRSFVCDFPNPVNAILNHHFMFRVSPGKSINIRGYKDVYTRFLNEGDY
jgi:hypothetical protein